MALLEGLQYGLSSPFVNKTVIFVKLTDSAIRAIDDYLEDQVQHKAGPGHRATLRFQGNEGNILIPSSSNENGHSFDFSLSTNSDIEGPQGSFECIQQCGPRSLESAGPLPYKMRIKANDDVFVQTQHRFNELEQERKQECAKEIKSNCADIGRKVKKKIGMPPLPQRREKSPSYISHHQQPKHPSAPPNFANSSNNSQKLPNGYSNNSSSNSNASNINNSRKVINGTSNGNGIAAATAASVNGTGSKNGVSSGSQDVSKRPLKERLIHMLAVKPYKKPELFQRLYSDGLRDRDKKIFMTILQQIANFKDNEYSLLRGVWNDVQEDWNCYSEQERQLMKRRKPQNLTPPGSDSSVGSGTSSLSHRSNSSIGSGHSPTSYSHISNYKTPVTTSGSGDGSYKGLPPSDGTFELPKGVKRPIVNGILTESVEDYGGIPHKRTRTSHFKRPGSGGSSNGNGANGNHSSRSELAVKHDTFQGSSPQYSSQNNRIAERLSPIGSSNSNFSDKNGSNGNGQLGSNHRSPRNGSFEPMDTSPSPHSYAGSNGYQSSSQGDPAPDEPVTVGSTWQSRNGNHDPHVLSDSEKPGRGDSDDTDSIDSGNGSSSSGVSNGGSQHQNYTNGYSNGGISGAHPVTNVQGGYPNGLTIKPVVVKSESTSSSDHNNASNNSTSNLTNGCNRVSSTTNFHNTPQSSPDSQVDNLQLQQQKCQSINNVPVMPSKHNQKSNGKCNFEMNAANIDIIVTRDKGVDRDSHRDRDRSRKSEKDRVKDKERDSRNKDRSKRNSDKRHVKVLENGDGLRDLEKNGDSPPIKISSDYPSYLTRYTTITSHEQRSKFKEDFNTEYPEYRELHAVIDKVSKRFAHLEERLRQEERGTEGYEKIKELIVNEYYANKRDKKYQETRQKFQYLHEKLSHIKRLVADYDAQHQDQDTSNVFANGFLRNKTLKDC